MQSFSERDEFRQITFDERENATAQLGLLHHSMPSSLPRQAASTIQNTKPPFQNLDPNPESNTPVSSTQTGSPTRVSGSQASQLIVAYRTAAPPSPDVTLSILDQFTSTLSAPTLPRWHPRRDTSRTL